MKILILGGAKFLGYHLIEAALANRHEVTVFNRGQTNPELFPEIEKLIGDRDGNLDALKGRTWDAVIDTSGYVPRIVKSSATLLADSVAQYVFISSISVYQEPDAPGTDETAPVSTLDDESVEEITGETYGPLKALCEQAAEKAMPGRVLNIRPGLIVGPRDFTDRFTYWLARFERGGEVLAPAIPAHPAQIIDVRDLARWTIQMIENRKTGIYNATGHSGTLGDLFARCQKAIGSDAALTWVDDAFLVAHEAGYWVELPLWLPTESHVMMRISIDRALKDGLTFRSVETTARDTLAWANTRPAGHEWKAGLGAQKEKEILEKWHAQA